MDPERRYREDEIAAIFREAAEAQEAAKRHLSRSEGLTINELKQIGTEAGITPEFITRAAAAVDRTNQTVPPQTVLGIPVSVGQSVDLPGPLSDEGWELLVVDLRETFHAFGEVRREGSVRQWRNGNLHAVVEPTESGHRLRLATMKGSARTALAAAAAVAGMSLFLALVAFAEQPLSWVKMLPILLFAAVGLSGLGITAYRLPRWANERRRQMEEICARVVERATTVPTLTLGDASAEPRLDLEPESGVADLTGERRPGRSRA